jgi:hypothetical protein
MPITAHLDRLYSSDRLDRIAIGVSGLCMVHCLASAVIIGLLATAGGFLGSHWIHEVGLTVAMGLGAIALGRGALIHGFMMPWSIGWLGLGVMAGALTMPHGLTEALYTIVGVSLLALGHQLNRIAAE